MGDTSLSDAFLNLSGSALNVGVGRLQVSEEVVEDGRHDGKNDALDVPGRCQLKTQPYHIESDEDQDWFNDRSGDQVDQETDEAENAS